MLSSYILELHRYVSVCVHMLIILLWSKPNLFEFKLNFSKIPANILFVQV